MESLHLMMEESIDSELNDYKVHKDQIKVSSRAHDVKHIMTEH